MAVSALLPLVSGLTAFLGGAGCDGADSKCVQPKAVDSIFTVDASGDLKLLSTTKVGPSPGWLFRGRRPVLYAIITGDSTVMALELDAAKPNHFNVLGSASSSNATAPVHGSVDRTGQWIFLANYGGCDNCTGPQGAVSVMSIKEDGSLGEVVYTDTHHGHGVNPARQGCAHVHSAVASPFHDVVYVQDLGLDTITTYSVNTHTGALSVLSVVNSSHPGAGPRHLVVHPTLPFAYVVEEMGNSLSQYAVGADGSLTFVETTPTTDVKSGSKAGEIAITPNGEFIYVSNRGDCDLCSTVQGFKVAPTGKATRIGSGVKTMLFPRGMEVSPMGASLFVAGQGDGTLAEYGIEADGDLTLKKAILHGLGTSATITFAV